MRSELPWQRRPEQRNSTQIGRPRANASRGHARLGREGVLHSVGPPRCSRMAASAPPHPESQRILAFLPSGRDGDEHAPRSGTFNNHAVRVLAGTVQPATSLIWGPHSRSGEDEVFDVSREHVRTRPSVIG